jgi:hypothetical protein
MTFRWMSTRRPPLDQRVTAVCVTWGVARLGCDPSALLLFVVAGSCSIPHNAEVRREVFPSQLEAGPELVQVVLRAVLSTPVDAERRMQAW